MLLKNPENLNEARNEKQRLEKALNLNKPLATAYYLKENLRQLLEQGDKFHAEIFLDDWIGRAEISGIKILRKIAQTLNNHRDGILEEHNFLIMEFTMADGGDTGRLISLAETERLAFSEYPLRKMTP